MTETQQTSTFFAWYGVRFNRLLTPGLPNIDLVIGAFDVVAEFWPHVAMIVYRVQRDDHLLLERIFRATSILELCGTFLETAIVMWLFGSLWSRWTLAYKIVTPVLHVLFSIAQLWGAWIFNRLRLKEKEQRKQSLF